MLSSGLSLGQAWKENLEGNTKYREGLQILTSELEFESQNYIALVPFTQGSQLSNIMAQIKSFFAGARLAVVTIVDAKTISLHEQEASQETLH